MKKLVILIIVLSSVAFIISEAFQNKKMNVPNKAVQKVETTTKVTKQAITTGDGHEKQKSDCKACHTCEYPTKDDPCLNPCPREGMVSVYHSPEEGPEVVMMNQNGQRYGKLVFSHKLHAQMSGMNDGCSNCHHYNTTGPVLPCGKCHSDSRKRENIGVPDYKAAIHRQCMDCHREWDKNFKCESCHLVKGKSSETRTDEQLRRLKGLSHPPLQQPEKVVYNTKYEKGQLVTFFHAEHTKLFGLECVSCHKNESCTKCHHTTAGTLVTKSNKLQLARTEEEQHKPCFVCHKNDNCNKCHLKKEMSPFNHSITAGFDLGKNHSSLACAKCHQNSNYKGLNKNCTSCHKNFTEGKFNHNVTGIFLDDNHSELECVNCHANKDFSKKPVCSECHDDFSYPAKIPGKIIGTKK